MSTRIASALPVGTTFSPDLIDLAEFLRALCRHSGNRSALQGAIWTPPVHTKHSRVPESRRAASLPIEAAVQYRLLEKGTWTATLLAHKLSKLSGDALYEAFARHILIHLGGLRLTETADQMQRDRDFGLTTEAVTGPSLARRLTSEGFRVSEQNTQINSLRMWLSLAGVFGSGRGSNAWRVDTAVRTRLLGIPSHAIPILAGMQPEQLAFVEALASINPAGWRPAASIRDLSEARSGLRLSRSSLPKVILEPLRRAGLIDYRTTGTRSGKTSELHTTPAFDADLLQPFVAETVRTLDPIVTAYYAWKPADIYDGLDDPSTFVKGQALEAYAIHLMRLLGLRFVGWRTRGVATGGSEIDAAFHGVFGGLPTLWQVQCKNTPHGRTDLEDVAREVGITRITHATHLLLVARGGVTADARAFASQVMSSDPLTVFLLDERHFRQIRADPAALGQILRTIAGEISERRPLGPAHSLFRPPVSSSDS